MEVTMSQCTVCFQEYPDSELIAYQKDRVCIGCKENYFQKIREGVEFSTKDLNYASIGRRFGANVIDGIILFIFQMVLTFLLMGAAFAGTAVKANPALAGTSFIVTILYLLFGVAYYVVLIGWKGATLGKMAVKVKVVRPDGSPVNFGVAFLRYIGTFISGIILGIGYFIAFNDAEKRTLHDRIAGTRVINDVPQAA
jgi:uncharacterized RDD family membrane protein YckC